MNDIINDFILCIFTHKIYVNIIPEQFITVNLRKDNYTAFWVPWTIILHSMVNEAEILPE